MNKLSIIISILALAGWLIYGQINSSPTLTEEFVQKNYSTFYKYKGEPKLHHRAGDYEKLDIKTIYANRIANYKENSQKLSSIIQFMSGMLIVGLLMLFFRPKSLQLPVVSINIPDTLLYLAVPIGLVYLWLQFGLMLNSGIDSRLALQHMTELLEFNEETNESVSYFYSNANNFSDNGIIDTWCNYYYKVFKEGDINEGHEWLGIFGLFGIYGVFIALIFSVTLLLIAEFKLIKKVNGIWVLYIFCAAMFLLSSGAFIGEFLHAYLFISFVWLLVGILVLIWTIYRRRVYQGAKIST